jgi:O-antigen ligase
MLTSAVDRTAGRPPLAATRATLVATGGDSGAAPAVSPLVHWMFYLFIFSLPFEYPKRTFPVEVTTLTCGVFLLATLLQVRACFRWVPRALPWFGAFLYAFLVSFAFSGGEYGSEVRKFFLLLLQLVLMLWASYGLLRDERVARIGLIVLVTACVLRAGLQLSGVAATSHAEWTGGERVSALGQNANHSAMILTAGLIALVGLAYGRQAIRRPRAAVVWPLAITLGVAIVQNASRGAILALAAGVAAFSLGGRTPWSRVRNVVIALLALALLVWASYSSEALRNRFKRTAETHTMAGRERLFPTLWQMFLERPVLGWGPINNKYELGARLPEQQRPRRDSHNVVLEVLTGFGLLGAAPFLVGVAMCIRSAWRARHGPEGVLPLAMIVAVLIANMSGNWIASQLLWLTLAYALASDGATRPASPRNPRCAA